MSAPVSTFEANFCPTDEQVAFAVAYANANNLASVFIPVNFPGKKKGLWSDDQERQEVFGADGSFMFWTIRNIALDDLYTDKYGTAIFRVWNDGGISLVDEL